MYSLLFVSEAIELYKANKSYRLTAKILRTKYNRKITRQSIMNWVKLFENDLTALFQKKLTASFCKNIIKSKEKVSDLNILNSVLKIIQLDPFAKRNEIIEAIHKEHKVKLTHNKLSTIFKKLNLTRKKPRQYIVKTHC